MNILVIGNGFDLAHGLPTKYIDFLNFCKSVRIIYTWTVRNEIDEYLIDLFKQMNNKVVNALKTVLNNRKLNYQKNQIFGSQFITDNEALNETFHHINDNIWISYFTDIIGNFDKNWIDFESEISKVIKSIDADMKEKDFEDRIDRLSNGFLMNKYQYYKISYDELFAEEGQKIRD